MIRIRLGKVIKILEEDKDIQFIQVSLEGEKKDAINYPPLTGKVEINDIVQVNTTAVTLGLGTGGYHFVIANTNNKKIDCTEKGHIIKLRYTPQQIKVLAVEESASPYHEKIKSFSTLNGTPVIIGFLHSMLLPALAGIKAVNENLKVSYVMTDGGALPLAFSKIVKKIKKLNLLNGIVTTGHAFGGDLEAVNIYSGLAAAYTVFKPDIIIVVMGPGVVGTGTELGTTALEVGQIINAVYSLGGRPIIIPRINFNDQRERHQGISHHVVTVLKKIALVKGTVVFPQISDFQKYSCLLNQIEKHKLKDSHKIVFEDGLLGFNYLKKLNLEIFTMGKGLEEEKEFFQAACATGTYTAKISSNFS